MLFKTSDIFGCKTGWKQNLHNADLYLYLFCHITVFMVEERVLTGKVISIVNIAKSGAKCFFARLF